MPDLSVVVVSYNTRALLDRCLRSVAESGGGLAIETIVVDNGSTDGSLELVRERHAGVQLVASETNLGFSSANNVGMREASGRYILLLNSDAEIAADVDALALRKLADFLDSRLEAGIVGPQLLHSDRSLQGVAKAFPTPLAALFGRKTLATRLWPNNRFSRRYLLERHNDGTEPFEVDSVSGACLMARRAAVQEVGALDEGYFMYWEDVDWCRRFKRAGWKVYCLPEARVVHHEGQSSQRQSDRLIVEFHRSAYRYYCKHHATTILHPMRLLAFVGLVLRAGLLLAAHLPGRARAPAATAGSPDRGVGLDSVPAPCDGGTEERT